MLNILVSRYNRVVEDAIFSRAIGSYREGEEVYILVPEQFTLQNEIRLMDQLGDTAVSHLRIMSFQRLALEALSKMGGSKRTVIDSMGKSMVLKNILYSHREELDLYAGSVEKEGFVDALLRQMAELKRSMITPEQLREFSMRVKNAELLSKKLSELAKIYESFDAELSGKYVDNEDRLGQLAELRDLPHLAGKRIYIYSFLDFTAVERQIISDLIHSSAEVNVGLCLDLRSTTEGEEAVFRSSFRTFELLQKAAREDHIPCEIEMLEEKDVKQSDEIRYLGEQLFRVIPTADDRACQDLSILETHSIDEEIHHIAMEISRAVVEEGYRYKDLMVVSGDLGAYSAPIRQIFSQYEIPFFVDEKRPILNSPIVKVILSAIDMLRGDLSVANIMVFLKNDVRYMGEEVSRIYHFENYVLSKKLKHKMFLDDRYFVFEDREREQETAEDVGSEAAESSQNADVREENATVSIREEIEEAVLSVRREILDLFLPFMERAQGKKTAREFGELIYELLEKQDMTEKIRYLVEDLRKNGLSDEANENDQIWNIFVRILEQANEVFGEERMSLERYRSLIVQAIRSHKIAVIPPTQDQVIIGDVERSRNESRRVLYLCGANSGSIPRAYQESGVLTQEEKTMLAQLDMDIPSERDRVDGNEQLLIYILLTRPTEKLCISYSTEGSRLRSPLIDEIRQVYPKILFQTIRDRRPIDCLSMPRPTIDKMAKEIKKLIKGEPIDEIWREVLTYYRQDEKMREITESAMDGIFYNNVKHRIRSADRLYPSPMKLSTTRLKSFEECPFKHFIRYGLKAKERKEYSIQPAEMGLVLHSTVEQVVRGLKNEPERIFDITREQMDHLVEGYFDDSAQKLLKEYDLADSRNRSMLKRLKKTAKQIGFASVEHMRSGRFELIAQEARFDDNMEIPPIIIDLNGKEIKLTGTIDRVDVLRDGKRVFVKIIDYKTSDKEFSLSDAYQGLDIQLMVYLSAVLESDRLTKTKNYPAGVFYFPITDPMIETQERSMEEIEKLIKSEIRMDGIVLDEEVVLRGLDERYDGTTKFRSAVYDDNAKKRLSEKQFRSLIQHIHRNIEKSLSRMMDGEIAARPIAKNGKKDESGCRFCRYASICRFEEELGDSYRPVYKYKDRDILERLEKEEGGVER